MAENGLSCCSLRRVRCSVICRLRVESVVPSFADPDRLTLAMGRTMGMICGMGNRADGSDGSVAAAAAVHVPACFVVFWHVCRDLPADRQSVAEGGETPAGGVHCVSSLRQQDPAVVQVSVTCAGIRYRRDFRNDRSRKRGAGGSGSFSRGSCDIRF